VIVMSEYAVDRLAPGDHVCWIFEQDREYLPAMGRFVATGLRERQRVVYFTGSLSPETVAAGLALHTPGVPDAVCSGQLRLDPAGGRLDPAGLTAAFEHDIDRAIDDGYTGLRVIADMGWASGETHHLQGYEERANGLFLDGRALAVCLYDRRLFGAAGLHALSCAHPSTAGPYLPDSWVPMLRVRRTGPASATLSGEADLSNRRALGAVLDLLLAETDAGPIRLDVSGLTFLDAGAAGLLAGTVAAAPAGVVLAGVTPAVGQVLTMTGVSGLVGLRLGAAA
jgi:anti-anti-sigma factor